MKIRSAAVGVPLPVDRENVHQLRTGILSIILLQLRDRKANKRQAQTTGDHEKIF